MKSKQKMSLLVILVVILVLTSASPALSQSDVQSWIKRRLTKNAGHSQSPSLALSGGNVHVVWADSTPGNNEIYYRRSTDNGATWRKMKRLTKNTGESWQPAVAVFGNNIHVVWSDDTPGNYDIYYKRSMDNGLTWSKQKRLTRNAGGSRQPAIALSGRNIHVVWWDETPGNDEVYYKCSTNNGATWGKQKRLTNSAESSTDATIAVSGGSIHVAWGEDNIIEGSEIYYRRSTDNGATWRKAKRLTNNGKTSIDPDIAVSGGNIHVTWSDYSPGNADIFYKGSKDNGATWGKRIRLTKNAGESATPAVAVLSKTVYVVWDDDTPGNVELYYKWSADGGAIWRKQTRLTRNAGGSRAPDVALWGGNIHIVWSDSTLGNTDIYYKRGP